LFTSQKYEASSPELFSLRPPMKKHVTQIMTTDELRQAIQDIWDLPDWTENEEETLKHLRAELLRREA
jgi:Zn-dependent oligopeptidase